MDIGNCYVGIDGGGTKAFMRAADANDNVIWEGKGGSTNLCSNTQAQVRDNLRELFGRAEAETGITARAVCLGSAGISRPGSGEILRDIIEECSHCSLVRIVGDMEIPLEASAPGEDALVVIAGTGSICYGRNAAGESARSGGWGHIFGDEGSGYWMACQGLNAVMRAYDGRGEPTCLTELFLERYGAGDAADITARLYNGPFSKHGIAAAAGLIDEAAARGDAAASSIIDAAARHLFDLAKAVIQKIRPDGRLKIFLSGGVALSRPIREKLSARLLESYPSVSVAPVKTDAAWGAVIIAKRMCGQ